MAKTKISEFSTTPGNNTDINGINIAEGCAPSGINNAIRELMSDLKEWQSGAMDVYVIPQGTAAAPGIQLYGDLDTGLYGFAANQLGVAVGGASAGYFSSAGWVGNVVATTIDLTNIEVTNIKAKDGTAAITIADSTGVVSVSTQLAVDNLNLSGNTLSSSDTNGNIILAPNGTGDVYIDADTIRVGDSNTNVTITSNGTADLILNTNSGTNSGSITIEDGVNGNIIIAPNGTGQVQITNAALDLTTIEVTNIKAKDGTAAASIADSTGVMTIASSVLTTTDINGGTIDGAVIGGSSAAAGTFTTITGTQVNSDNLRLDGNTLSSTDANGNIIIAPDGIGQVHISNTVAVGLYQEIASNSRTPGVTSLQVGQGASGEAYVVNRANNYLVLGANGAERARISANGAFRIKGAGTAGTSDAVVINQSAPTDSFVINASGQVGIGTSPTSSTLTVSAAGASQTLISTTGTNGASSGFANTGGTVSVGINGSAATPAYAARISHSGTYPISFYTDSVERARINSDGILSGWSGTNSAPTFSYTNDPNTGMYFPAADAVGFAAGGTEIVRITSTGLQVTDIKAKDGTAALSIADSTGVVSVSANPVLSGGTANGVLYLNASKVATSGSALTYDGSYFTAASGTGAFFADIMQVSGTATKVNANGVGLEFRGGATPNITSYSRVGSAYLPVTLDALTSTFSISGTERMRLNSTSLNIGGNFTSTNNTLQVTGNAAIGYTTAAPTTGLIVAGNVGFGTSSPSTSLTINKAVGSFIVGRTADSNASVLQFGFDPTSGESYIESTRSGTGTNLNLAFWTGGSRRATLDTSGNLGIGTNAPNTNVEISTTVDPILRLNNSTNTVTTGADIGEIQFYTNDASVNGTGVKAFVKTVAQAFGSAQGGADLVFGTAAYAVGDASEKMRIDKDGNVGIGTNAPASFNQVVNAPHLVVGNGSNAAGVTVYSATNASGSIAFADGTTTTDQYRGRLQYAHADDSMRLFTSSTERMRITSAGNVGIGTDAPDYKLQVSGTTGQTFSIERVASAIGSSTALGTIVGTGEIPTLTADGASIQFLGAGTWSATSAPGRIVFNTTPVSTTTPVERLQLTTGEAVVNDPGNDYDFRVESDNNTHMLFVDAGTDRVGVGTSSPGGVFHTVATAAGAASIGGILQNADNSLNSEVRLLFAPNLSTNWGNRQAYISGVNVVGGGTATELAFGSAANGVAPVERMRIDKDGNVRVGTAALATTATNGFLYIPTCAGTPTGTPTAITGLAPMVIDSTNNKLYIYSGGAWVALN